MEIVFHRGKGAEYFALARREDGVRVRLQGFAYDRRFDQPLPHDLAHFVVEHELSLKAGLWGVIAAGGLFGPNMVVGGRQRPHAADRGREVKKRAGDRLGQAEVLVRILCEIARAGEEDDPAVLDRIPVRRRPADLSAGEVRRACQRLREAARRWAAVPQGGSLASLGGRLLIRAWAIRNDAAARREGFRHAARVERRRPDASIRCHGRR